MNNSCLKSFSLVLACMLLSFFSGNAFATSAWSFKSVNYCALIDACNAYAADYNASQTGNPKWQVSVDSVRVANSDCLLHKVRTDGVDGGYYYQYIGPGDAQLCACTASNTPQFFNFRSNGTDSICNGGCSYIPVDPDGTGKVLEIGTDCDSNNFCNYSGYYKKTDQACTTPTASGTSTSRWGCGTDSKNCTGNYCGQFNNETICVDGIQAGECAVTPNGATVCVEKPLPGAPSSQKPDNNADGIADSPTGRIASSDSGF